MSKKTGNNNINNKRNIDLQNEEREKERETECSIKLGGKMDRTRQKIVYAWKSK